MQAMFCGSRFNGDISRWNVSNVTNMHSMFACSLFNGDISKWDVSSVTNMEYMFAASQFNGDISHWNVSDETNLGNMFGDSPIALANDFPPWFRNVEPMNKLVASDRENLEKIIQIAIARKGPECDLNYIDVSNVTDMSDLFKSSNFNGDISKWDVSNVTNMNGMFIDSQFNGDISQWDVSNLTQADSMFARSQFKGDIRQWKIPETVSLLALVHDANCQYDKERAEREEMADCLYNDMDIL
jgi:surface protein